MARQDILAKTLVAIEKITTNSIHPRKKSNVNQKNSPEEEWDGEDGSVRKMSTASAGGPKVDPQKPCEKRKKNK